MCIVGYLSKDIGSSVGSSCHLLRVLNRPDGRLVSEWTGVGWPGVQANRLAFLSVIIANVAYSHITVIQDAHTPRTLMYYIILSNPVT